MVALAAHALALALLMRVSVRAAPPSSSRVTLVFLAPADARSAPVLVPAHPPREAPQRRGTGADPVGSPGTEAPAVDDVRADPAREAKPQTGPEPLVRSRTRESLMERAIVGAEAGPRPSLDALDPSRATAGHDESDRARAQRFADRIARVDALRALPPDAGPSSVLTADGPARSTLLELEPTGDGGYRYRTGGFVAEIHDDGSVSFTDKTSRSGLAHGGDRGNATAPYGAAITSQRADPAAVLGSGSFDPTAVIMRAMGQDPYEAERSCFLDDTRDLRADLREQHDLRQLAQLRTALERAWSSSEPALARRARLFAMWDECREDGGVGPRARELVVSFIRQNLPRASPAAYTDAELDALNARRASAEVFRPYG